MNEIPAAIETIDQLIALRKSALADAAHGQAGQKADSRALMQHKAALKTLRMARRLLTAYRKNQRRKTV